MYAHVVDPLHLRYDCCSLIMMNSQVLHMIFNYRPIKKIVTFFSWWRSLGTSEQHLCLERLVGGSALLCWKTHLGQGLVHRGAGRLPSRPEGDLCSWWTCDVQHVWREQLHSNHQRSHWEWWGCLLLQREFRREDRKLAARKSSAPCCRYSGRYSSSSQVNNWQPS